MVLVFESCFGFGIMMFGGLLLTYVEGGLC